MLPPGDCKRQHRYCLTDGQGQGSALYGASTKMGRDTSPQPGRLVLVNFFLCLCIETRSFKKCIRFDGCIFKDRICNKVCTGRSFIEVSVWNGEVGGIIFLLAVLLTTCK